MLLVEFMGLLVMLVIESVHLPVVFASQVGCVLVICGSQVSKIPIILIRLVLQPQTESLVLLSKGPLVVRSESVHLTSVSLDLGIELSSVPGVLLAHFSVLGLTLSVVLSLQLILFSLALLSSPDELLPEL